MSIRKRREKMEGHPNCYFRGETGFGGLPIILKVFGMLDADGELISMIPGCDN